MRRGSSPLAEIMERFHATRGRERSGISVNLVNMRTEVNGNFHFSFTVRPRRGRPVAQPP